MPLFRETFLFYRVLWDFVVNTKKLGRVQGFRQLLEGMNSCFRKVGDFRATRATLGPPSQK